jgi:hypothetical protein
MALRPDSSVVERGPEKAGVGGSIPSLATTSVTHLRTALYLDRRTHLRSAAYAIFRHSVEVKHETAVRVEHFVNGAIQKLLKGALHAKLRIVIQ